MRLAVGQPLASHVVGLRPGVSEHGILRQVLVCVLVSCGVLLVDGLGRVVYNIYLVAHKHVRLIGVRAIQRVVRIVDLLSLLRDGGVVEAVRQLSGGPALLVLHGSGLHRLDLLPEAADVGVAGLGARAG